MELSIEQNKAINYVTDHIDSGVVALDGPAGSGKTTLLKELVNQFRDNGFTPVVSATTNKAAQVLRTKGLPNAVTMHQACLLPVFKPPLDTLGEYLQSESEAEPPTCLLERYPALQLEEAKRTCESVGVYAAFRELGITDAFHYLSHWANKPAPRKQQKRVLLIDEASMISDDLMPLVKDSFEHIVLIGDGNQLPPVQGKPVFWQVRNRVKLKEIHRQADSAEPLLLAHDVLTGKSIQHLFDAASNRPQLTLSASGVPIICWRNARRLTLTRRLRKYLGCVRDMPIVGETIICRNSQDRKYLSSGLVNNTYWQVEAHDRQYSRYSLINDIGETVTDIPIYMEETNCGSGLPFRFGYAVTCHTAQGSEWDEIMIDAKDAAAHLKAYPVDARKWLYTAITRARHKVHFLAL